MGGEASEGPAFHFLSAFLQALSFHSPFLGSPVVRARFRFLARVEVAQAAFLCWITVALLCFARELQLLLSDVWYLSNVVLIPALAANVLMFGLAIDRWDLRLRV